jgi:glycosyltransferase involved in cell wall biosynthesis
MGPRLERVGSLNMAVCSVPSPELADAPSHSAPRRAEMSKQPGPSARPLRVLMLDAAGSSVQVTHNLANHLGELGCEVEVFTAPHWLRAVSACQPGSYRTRVVFYRGTQFQSYEARSAVAKHFWRIVRLIQHAAAMRAIYSMARHFDVVHTQILPVPLLDYFCLRLIARHTPVVCTVHELVPHGSRLQRFTGEVLKAIYRRASLLFVYTNHTRDRLVRQLGIAANKIVRIPHGNLEHMVELKGSTSYSEQPVPVILFIGGIRRDKGLDILIRAAGHLRKRVRSFKVCVAGTPGFDLSTIRKLVADLELQDLVDFHLGYLPEREFADYLSTATVVALPYRRIEQSGVAIAACTFGKAIVATRCGGVEELVTAARNGLLVPVDDPVALAEALAVLLVDHEKRRLFESRSFEYAREALSWEPIARQTTTGYRAAISARQNP